jgi:hypothetical protein
MKKQITDYVPKIKNLPEMFVFAIVVGFLIGLIYNPFVKTEQSSMNPLVHFIRDTVFLTRDVEETVPKNVEDIAIYDNSRSYGYNIKDLNELELRKELQSKEYRNLKNLNLYKLRRLVILNSYNDMLMQVHHVTDFPVSLLYSTFIFEATSNGIETLLWRKYANPGGVKAIKGYSKVSLKTNEYIGGRKKYLNQYFFKGNTSEEGIQIWSSVFNNKRYQKCKKANYKTPSTKLYKTFCRCMYNAGYHTDPNYAARASIMNEYWEFKRNHLPVVKEEF